MSQTVTRDPKPETVVRENREVFERVAATELPYAPYAQKALDLLEEQ